MAELDLSTIQERDVLLQTRVGSGEFTMDYPFTRLRLIDATADERVASLNGGEFIPIYDDNVGSFEKILVSNFFKGRNVEFFSLSVASSSWSNGSKTLSNSKIVKANNIYLIFPATSSDRQKSYSCGFSVSPISENGSITFTASSTPESDINVNVLRVEVTGASGQVFGDFENITSVPKLTTARSIGLSGVTAAAQSFDGSSNITIPITKIPASLIDGVLDLGNIPSSAVERCYPVANTAARLALTTNDVQNGDTVKENDTGLLYLVIDETKLNSESGYTPYKAAAAASVPWSGVTDKPSFAPVATSGSYNDLDNKPTIPTTLPPTSHKSTHSTGGSDALTPSDIGAAAASHGTHVSYAGTGGNYGSAASVARSDHTHDAQTSVSGNAGSATKLATSRTIDGVSFDGQSNIAHFGTCSTAADTAAKTVALTGFTLEAGARVSVKFTNANTAASPTLNVNSTGAKAIVAYGTTVGKANVWKAGAVIDLIYDGTSWVVDNLSALMSVTDTGRAVTIPTTGWVSNPSGNCNYYVDVTVTGITASMVPNVILDVASQSVASVCGLCPTVESLAGKLRFRAVAVPSSAMTGTCYTTGTIL